MSEDGHAVSGDGSGEITRLREHILQTRAELGATVEALAARADVRARMRETAKEAKTRVRQSAQDAVRSPVPWMVLLAATAAVAALVVLKRRAR
jgi:anti-sigma-K factor RskA